VVIFFAEFTLLLFYLLERVIKLRRDAVAGTSDQ